MAKRAAAAPTPGPGIAMDAEPEDLDVSVQAVDTFPITPDEIHTHPSLNNLGAFGSEFLASQVSARLVEMLDGREPWRQGYIARVPGWGDLTLDLPRWPIEEPIADATGFSVPQVTVRSGVSSTNETVKSANYTIKGSRCRKTLYSDLGWQWTTQTSGGVTNRPMPGLELNDYTVGNGGAMGAVGSLTAGYLMPGQIGSNPQGPRLSTPTAALDTWQATTAYGVDQSTANGDAVGSFVRSTDKAQRHLIFECTAAGTSLASEPTWNMTIGATTAEDAGPTWTTRAAVELPRIVRDACWLMAKLIYNENKGTPCAHSEWMKVSRWLSGACV